MQLGGSGGGRVPLDEALAWANLSFLALFLGVVVAAVVLRRRTLRRRDLALYGLLGMLLVTLLAEYHVRRTSYAAERAAAQEYEITVRYANQARVLDMASPGWDPTQQAANQLAEVRRGTAARLLRTQSVTTVLFTLFAAGIGFLVLERRARQRGAAALAGVLAAAVAFAVWCAWPLWRAWPGGPLDGQGDGPASGDAASPLAAALISVGPGVAMAALGAALVAEYRRLASLSGVLLSLGVVLYGVLQLSEIGERLADLGERQRELYRFGMLSLALGLRVAMTAALVQLPLVRASRAQIQRWMARVPGGAALATLRSDRVLEIRDPDAMTRRLPLALATSAAHGRDAVYELDLRELEGAWGTRVTRPGAGSAEYLASPPDALALFRVLLIPLPTRFLGGDHLLLTLEAESVLRLLPRAKLGLVLLRAAAPTDRAGDMRVWWCNDHVGRLFGGRPAELCGRRLASLVHPDWRPRLDDVRRDDYSSVLAAAAGGAVGRPAGFVRITACPFGDAAEETDGAPAEMLLMMVSSLSSDSHTHTDFLLHNLAHTLRTPIQLVRGALDRVALDLAGPAEFDPRDALDRLRRARAEATRLEHAVDLNLQVGRDLIERGEAPERFELGAFVRDEVLGAYVELAPEELAPVVRATRAKLRGFRERGGAYVAFDAAPGAAPIDVLAYRAPLKVMLRELVENALHYARAAGPPPSVTVVDDPGGPRVRVENEVDPAEVERHEAGLVRESQGLSCVRFLSVRYGHPFRIGFERGRGRCVATVEMGRAPQPAARPVEAQELAE
jgi:signal transduction histidine kinase